MLARGHCGWLSIRGWSGWSSVTYEARSSRPRLADLAVAPSRPVADDPSHPASLHSGRRHFDRVHFGRYNFDRGHFCHFGSGYFGRFPHNFGNLGLGRGNFGRGNFDRVHFGRYNFGGDHFCHGRGHFAGGHFGRGYFGLVGCGHFARGLSLPASSLSCGRSARKTPQTSQTQADTYSSSSTPSVANGLFERQNIWWFTLHSSGFQSGGRDPINYEVRGHSRKLTGIDMVRKFIFGIIKNTEFWKKNYKVTLYR